MDLKASIKRSSSINTLSFNEQFKDYENRYELGIVFGFSTVEEPNLIRGCYGACHAYLNRINDWLPTGKLKTYYSQLRSLDKNAEEYWSSLLDPKTSPWRTVLKNPTVIRDDDGKAIAFSTDIEPGTSSQCLANLSIATRKPAELRSFMPTWLALRDKLGDANLATLGAHQAQFTGDTLMVYQRTPGHHCLPVEGHSVNSFIKGTPNTDKSLLVAQRSGYSPCNEIWVGNTHAPAHVILANKDDTKILFKDVYKKIREERYGLQPLYTNIKDLSKFLLEVKENPNA